MNRPATWQERGLWVDRAVFAPPEMEQALSEAHRLYQGDRVSQQNLRCRWANHVDTGECRLDAFDPVIDLSPTLARLAQDPRLLSLAADLLGEPAHLFKDKLIFKPAGAPGYDLHQDWIAWDGFPRSFLTAIVALEPSDAASGGTEFFPGMHRQGSLVPANGNFNRLDPQVVADVPGEIPTLAPGDVVWLSGFLPHRSGPNRSARSRTALFFSYNANSDGGDQRMAHYVQFRAWLREQYARHGRFDVSFR